MSEAGIATTKSVAKVIVTVALTDLPLILILSVYTDFFTPRI